MCFWTLGVAHQENSVLEKVQFALRVPSPLQQELGGHEWVWSPPCPAGERPLWPLQPHWCLQQSAKSMDTSAQPFERKENGD